MKTYRINAGSRILALGPQTKIMGIVNLTPDSFSRDGHLHKNKKSKNSAFNYAQKLIRDGADILDIGGESSRPGSNPVSIKEEIKRVIPMIHQLTKKCAIPISIDTYKPDVAQAALDEGASIVNNIMGTKPNKKLLKIVKNYQAAIVLMHMRGTPKTMQKNIRYQNLIQDILHSLRRSIEICLEIGIKSDKILIDPGIGFGKTTEHNLEIINHLREFQKLNQPILIGPSRKSFIGNILNVPVDQRLFGTIAACCVCALKGAHILRVHDVKAVQEAVTMVYSINQKHNP